jgi:4-amino-4-deoxy-L-arabinose transferase-like glycosyltransferase
MRDMTRKRLIDTAWLLALAAYILAGMPLASFHGDEAMQVYMSHDYARAFIYGDVNALKTRPPYDIDTDPQLRILNGSVNRYAIGLSWHLAGFTNGDLPPRPGWDWGLSVDRNTETGHRPPETLLNVARLSSALFLALSVPLLFGLAWQFGGRPAGYVATALYALNPVVLLNGRRAMQEGAMLFFGLAAVLVAALISRQRAAGERVHPLLWTLLPLVGGLALASKHSAVVFVAGAFGWLVLAELTHFRLRAFARLIGALALTGALTAGLFVLLSPALWDDPAARVGDLLAVRARLLDIQVAAHTNGVTSLPQRVEAIFREPFLAPPQHYEVAYWTDSAAAVAEIDRYMASPLSGIQFGAILGLPLTLLALLGLPLAFTRQRALAAGLLAWLVVIAVSLLANPLPWQRYFLPLYPAAALLVGISVAIFARWTATRTARSGRLQSLAHLR